MIPDPEATAPAGSATTRSPIENFLENFQKEDPLICVIN
jgi:hypothetical protein